MTTEDEPPRRLPGGVAYVYVQLADDIAARIAAGEFRPGTRLPGRSRLAEEYGVGEMTVRRAVEELQARGITGEPSTRGAMVL